MTVKMKAVSVVVPCYNVSRYLGKCIEQLLCQTIGQEAIEIILVDDRSTDQGATWNIITAYEEKFQDVIIAVSLDQNMRQGGARNIGVSYASGEYLMFCDADDWLFEEALERCYHIAQQYEADVVEFPGKSIRNRQQPVEIEKGARSRLIVIDTEDERKKFLLCSSGGLTYASQRKLYRRSMIVENNIAFAEHLILEEPSFTLPVRLYEKRHYFLDETLYIYYISPESTLRGTWEQARKKDNIMVWMQIMDDLTERGLLSRYYQELEYMFLEWGLGLSISMPLRKGYYLTEKELRLYVEKTLERFPAIRDNKYLKERNNAYIVLLVKLLDLDITEQSACIINEIFRKYI